MKTLTSKVFDQRFAYKALQVAFYLAAVMLGALYTWRTRYTVNPDGVSYLDLGDAIYQRDWNMAVNGIWSPLYPYMLGSAMFLVKPSPYRESLVAHLAGFAIYLCSLLSFSFFWRELEHNYYRDKNRKERGALPNWAYLVIGYSLFLWSSCILIGFSTLSPDFCVAAFLYLISGMVLRINNGNRSTLTFALFGLVLGCAYLAKVPMFVLAFIFLIVSVFPIGNIREALRRGAIALTIFLLIGSIYFIPLSISKGRLTFGESGKFNYAVHVNKVSEHWMSEPRDNGTPKHPMRKIFDSPAIYEFRTPIKATYPIHYDPSYWYEGVTPHFEVKQQLNALMANFRTYRSIVFSTCNISLTISLLILFWYTGCGRGLRNIAAQWYLLVPAIAALSMYSLVHVESRYVGPFIVLLWLSIFSSVSFSHRQILNKLPTLVSITVATLVAIAMIISIARDFVNRDDPVTHTNWQVAEGLRGRNIQPGDQVAFIGISYEAYWARLAQVRIIAEAPEPDKFWAADDSTKNQAILTFEKAGARAIVTRTLPVNITNDGWRKIEDTDYYVYLLAE